MTEQEPAILYRLREDGIHEIIFKEASIRAVDAWIQQAEAIMNIEPPDKLVRAIYDNTQTQMLPLTHAVRRVGEFNKKYPNRQKTRVAFIVNAGFLTSLVDTFLSILRSGKDEIRFFSADKRR